MEIFISQRVTGMDIEKLKEETKKIAGILEENNHEAIYIIDYPEEFVNYPVKQRLIDCAFKEMDKCDAILVIVKSDDKSEGTLIEVGHILDKDKKIILGIHKDVQNTYLRKIADEVIEFEDIDGLCNKLKELK